MKNSLSFSVKSNNDRQEIERRIFSLESSHVFKIIEIFSETSN